MELEDTPSSMAIAGRSPRLHQCNHLTSDFTQDAFDSNAEVACNAVDEHNNSIALCDGLDMCRCAADAPHTAPESGSELFERNIGASKSRLLSQSQHDSHPQVSWTPC